MRWPSWPLYTPLLKKLGAPKFYLVSNRGAAGLSNDDIIRLNQDGEKDFNTSNFSWYLDQDHQILPPWGLFCELVGLHPLAPCPDSLLTLEIG